MERKTKEQQINELKELAESLEEGRRPLLSPIGSMRRS